MYNKQDILMRILDLADRDHLLPAEVCRKLGIAQSSFTDWKKGRSSPSLDNLDKFATFWNVPLEYLVYGTVNGASSDRLTTLSTTETKVIGQYRSLSDSGKARAEAYISGLYDTEKAADE